MARYIVPIQTLKGQLCEWHVTAISKRLAKRQVFRDVRGSGLLKYVGSPVEFKMEE